MIKALIIDDEPLARSLVKEYLKSFTDIQVMQECNDGFEGVKAIAQHQPDLIFLDVQMPKINGFEMLELMESPPAVIFTTAFDEYAMKAFEAHAVDYLLKPFSKDRFEKAVHKWLTQQPTNTKPATEWMDNRVAQPEEHTRIVVKNGSNIIIVPVVQIQYLEAYDDYVKIYTPTGMHLKKKTMAYFERVLDAKQFVRVHRSYLLNISELTRIEPMDKNSHVARLKTGGQIPLSESGYTKLKSVLGI
jgi:two-component system, LytTR family, response regulator